MLAYLLDGHLSPVIAEQLTAKNARITAQSVHRLRSGEFSGQTDIRVMRSAVLERLTLVTYDLKTIPQLLQEFAADQEPHAGVVFIDDASIRSNDFAGLVRALLAHWQKHCEEEWTNRIAFLEPAE